MRSLAQMLEALQHMYRHAAEPASELAYAEARPLLPVLEAACQRVSALLNQHPGRLPEQQKVRQPHCHQTAASRGSASLVSFAVQLWTKLPVAPS